MLSRRDRERQVDNENSVLRWMVIVGFDRSDDSLSRFIKDWTDQKFFFSFSHASRPILLLVDLFSHSYFRVRFFVSSLCLSLLSHSNLLELPPRQIKYLKKLEWRFKIKVNKRRGREWEMKNGRKLCFFPLMSPRNSIGLLVLPIFLFFFVLSNDDNQADCKKVREQRMENMERAWWLQQHRKLIFFSTSEAYMLTDCCWVNCKLVVSGRGWCNEYRATFLVQDIELYADAISIGSDACLFNDC